MQAKPPTRCYSFFGLASFAAILVGPGSMRGRGAFVAVALRVIDNLSIDRNSVASFGALIASHAFVAFRYADLVGLDAVARVR